MRWSLAPPPRLGTRCYPRGSPCRWLPLGYVVGSSVPLLGGNPIHIDLSVHHVAKALRSATRIALNMKDLYEEKDFKRESALVRKIPTDQIKNSVIVTAIL